MFAAVIMRIIIIFLLFLIFAGCSGQNNNGSQDSDSNTQDSITDAIDSDDLPDNIKSDEPADADADIALTSKAEWTLLYFISSDGDYPYTYMFNIQGLEAQGGSSDKINVLALYDGFLKGDSLYYHILADGNSETFKITTAPDSEVNMGDTKAYFDFIDWALARYPAKKYFVSFHDHGGGAVEPANEKSPGMIMPDNMLYDQTSSDSLDPDEQAAVIAYLSRQTGQKVDVVESMACLSQMIENTYGMGGYAKYHIGAESLSYVSDTFPLAYLREDPSAEAFAVADYLVKDHEAGMKNQNVPCHWSMIDIDEVKPLADLLKSLAEKLQQAADTAGFAETVRSIAGTAQNFSYTAGDLMSGYIDIKDFAQKLTGSDLISLDVKETAQEMITHIDNKLVIYNSYNNACHPQTESCSDYSHAYGISVYHPNDNNPFYQQKADPLYESLSFAKASGWSDYLKKISLEAPTGQLPKVYNLSAVLMDTRKVKISWDYKDESYPLYSAFYCSRDKGGVFTNVYYTVSKEKGKTSFEVIDEPDAAGTYQYRVTAYRSSDQKGSVNWEKTPDIVIE